jgi:hypothetical protein
MDALGGIRFGSAITTAARAHGLDPKLLAAVAAQETGGPGSNSGRNVVGDGGHGHGVFQIDDRTWSFGASAQAMDPAANANAAASILADDLARSGGNVRAALSTYNSGSPAGTGTKTTWADGATLGYADSVLRHYAALGGDPAQIVADNRVAATSVNALAGFTATQPLAGATAGTVAWAQPATVASGAPSAPAAFPPPAVTPTSQSPFAAPVSWANETSASGPAGGKLAADADSLVASEVDSVDDDSTSQA